MIASTAGPSERTVSVLLAKSTAITRSGIRLRRSILL
jgi:hypothetical protein